MNKQSGAEMIVLPSVVDMSHKTVANTHERFALRVRLFTLPFTNKTLEDSNYTRQVAADNRRDFICMHLHRGIQCVCVGQRWCK